MRPRGTLSECRAELLRPETLLTVQSRAGLAPSGAELSIQSLPADAQPPGGLGQVATGILHRLADGKL